MQISYCQMLWQSAKVGVSLFILSDDSIDEVLDFLWVVPNNFCEMI